MQACLPTSIFGATSQVLKLIVSSIREKELIPIEIKSGATLTADFFSSLVKWNALTGNDPATSYVIYGGEGEQVRSQGTALGWSQIGKVARQCS